MNGPARANQAQIISRQMPKKRLQAVLFMAGTMIGHKVPVKPVRAAKTVDYPSPA